LCWWAKNNNVDHDNKNNLTGLQISTTLTKQIELIARKFYNSKTDIVYIYYNLIFLERHSQVAALVHSILPVCAKK